MKEFYINDSKITLQKYIQKSLSYITYITIKLISIPSSTIPLIAGKEIIQRSTTKTFFF